MSGSLRNRPKCFVARDVPIATERSAANLSIFDNLVGAGEQRGRHGLFLTLGLIGTIVRPTSIRSSRNSSQFLYFSPDRTEWA